MIKIVVPNPKTLEFARKVAMRSPQRRSKMAAIALDRSRRVIDRRLVAFNYNIKSTINKNGKFSVHAEEHLIAKSCRYHALSIADMVVLVYRKKKVGAGNSKPCSRCRELLKKAGVKRVIYNLCGTWYEERL